MSKFKIIKEHIDDLPIKEAVTVGSEWAFVIIGFAFGMLAISVECLAALCLYVAARINGKGEDWQHLIDSDGIELCQSAKQIVASDKDTDGDYRFDHEGRELPVEDVEEAKIAAADEKGSVLNSSSGEASNATT